MYGVIYVFSVINKKSKRNENAIMIQRKLKKEMSCIQNLVIYQNLSKNHSNVKQKNGFFIGKRNPSIVTPHSI